MTTTNEQNRRDQLAVATDQELIEGIFEPGTRYYVRTPTFHYTGILVAVTPMALVLEDAYTVFESGELQNFFTSGTGTSEERHGTGRARCILDRAGAMLSPVADKAK